MFDFEKLDVYQLVKEQNIKALKYIYSNSQLDEYIKDQWKRASLSILLNLAEGTGRMTNADKKHFLTIARGSVFESVAILDTIKGMNFIEDNIFKEFYDNYETISKMLLGMFRSYNN
jgi:four helix bundle protein